MRLFDAFTTTNSSEEASARVVADALGGERESIAPPGPVGGVEDVAVLMHRHPDPVAREPGAAAATARISRSAAMPSASRQRSSKTKSGRREGRVVVDAAFGCLPARAAGRRVGARREEDCRLRGAEWRCDGFALRHPPLHRRVERYFDDGGIARFAASGLNWCLYLLRGIRSSIPDA